MRRGARSTPSNDTWWVRVASSRTADDAAANLSGPSSGTRLSVSPSAATAKPRPGLSQ